MLPLAVVLGLAATPAPGAAATGPSFSVSYVAGADCPTQATFEAALLARAPHGRRAAPGDVADLRFEVQLGASGNRRLRVTLADGTAEERDITADGCAEAMQSMALIAATMVEAQAPTAAAEPVESAPAPAEKPPEPPTATPPAEETRPVSSEPAPQAPQEQPSRSWFRLGLGGVAEGAAAPTPAFGGTLWGELGSSRDGAVAPSLRLGAVVAQAATVKTEAGEARFRLALGRVHACGLRAGNAAFELRLCALVEAGALFADGLNARNSRSRTMPWLAAGLGMLATAPISGPLALELGGGARGLVIHDEFAFSPQFEAHQVPVFAWNLSAGLSYRLW
jgi:hypothetical protein